MPDPSPGYDLSAANSQAAGEIVVRPILFATLEFSTETLRMCTAPFAFTWGGNSYTGLGHLGEVQAIEEGVELQTYRLRLILNGVPLALLSIALGSEYQGRTATIYLGFLNSDHGLVGDPDTVFRGRMDIMTITAGETGSIALDVESRLADWERPRVRRFNNADQQQRYPADKGLEFAEQMASKQLVWPAASFFN